MSRQREKDLDLIKKIITHHKKYGRNTLPWRKNINPYRVLVSEIMLQQTQVSRVLPKFTVWMQTYPTLTALKESTLRDILSLWKGLGYQRRAKALYTIAQSVVRLPRGIQNLTTLPGVGLYTASALCAFAYNRFEHPLLETNIRTVLVESFYKYKETVTDNILYEDLRRLETYGPVKKYGARNWYYALMDYGAFLKEKNISHNNKNPTYKKQTPYKDSFRKLRAEVLFAITKEEPLPKDERVNEVLTILIDEGFIVKTKQGYSIT